VNTVISIVIPAYNEESGIASVIKQIQQLPLAIEIVVVDDGSTDHTASVARKAGAIVVRRPSNIGYGKSIKDGIHRASNDTVVITDADATYPVDQIPVLLRRYDEGYDMVIGARQGVNYWSSPMKSLFRILLKALVEFTAGRKIPDINSGLRVFSKKTALHYESALCDTFSFTTTITLIYCLTKHTIFYSPIQYHKRIGASKVRIFRDSLRTFQYIIECIVLFNPIKLFVLLAATCVIIGLVSYVVLDWWGIFVGILFAIVTFSLGLLAHVLARRS
jgi:polyisoprenyl-phosphate glycosyltransferase